MVGYDPLVPTPLPLYIAGAAGFMSGFVTRGVSQPFDVLKIRLQVWVLIGAGIARCRY